MKLWSFFVDGDDLIKSYIFHILVPLGIAVMRGDSLVSDVYILERSAALGSLPDIFVYILLLQRKRALVSKTSRYTILKKEKEVLHVRFWSPFVVFECGHKKRGRLHTCSGIFILSERSRMKRVPSILAKVRMLHVNLP